MSSGVRPQAMAYDRGVCSYLHADRGSGPDADRLTAGIAAELRGLHASPSPSAAAR